MKKKWEERREGPGVVLNVSSAVASNCEQMFGHCGVEHLECLQPRSTQLENSSAAGEHLAMHSHWCQVIIPEPAVATSLRSLRLALATSV